MDYSTKKVEEHFDKIAENYDFWKEKNKYYYSSVKDFIKKNIPAKSHVAEFGCATGDILASTSPSRGLGIDNSSAMLELARKKHPHLNFLKASVEDLKLDEKFDFVVMVDLLDHTPDIDRTLHSAYKALENGGKIVITTANPIWEPLLALGEWASFKMPEGPHYFVSNRKIIAALTKAGFRIDQNKGILLCPSKIPLLAPLINTYVAQWPLFRRLCCVQAIVAVK